MKRLAVMVFVGFVGVVAWALFWAAAGGYYVASGDWRKGK